MLNLWRNDGTAVQHPNGTSQVRIAKTHYTPQAVDMTVTDVALLPNIMFQVHTARTLFGSNERCTLASLLWMLKPRVDMNAPHYRDGR